MSKNTIDTSSISEKNQSLSRVARHHSPPPTVQNKGTAEEKMVQSTAWLTVSNILSRLLGAIYVIPWYTWMQPHGEAANYLYSKGYNVYALFLMISTAGIPAAVAKQTAKYNSMNEYGLSKKLLLYTLRIMTVAGVLCTLVMFLGAPLLSQGNPALVPVMRSLSVVLLIFPAMSVLRGFFQGNNNMKPYAISQIIEQIARVFYMLVSAFIIMKISQGNYKTAVVHSTFAAFIGVALALVVLLFSLVKEHRSLHELEIESNNQLQFSGRQLVTQMVVQAVPFIIVGSGISIFKLIDQYSFEKIMAVVTNNTAATNAKLFALISANPDKLTMVVIALGTAMATAGLPLITEHFTKKDFAGLANLAANNFQLFFFVMMPASIGMMVLAYPLNTLFYRPNPLGADLLAATCIIGVIMGLFMVCSTMLQGLDGNRPAVAYLFLGIGVKLLTQYPLILMFQSYGALLSTFIGLLVANMFIIDRIHVVTGFPFIETAFFAGRITLLSLVMGIVASLTKIVCQWVLSPDSKLQALIIILVVAFAGGATYLILSLKTKIADELLGARVDKIRRLLNIR